MAKQYVCGTCRFVGQPESPSTGCATMAVLWLGGLFAMALFVPLGVVMLIGALAYTIYALIPRPSHCPKCNTPNMIPEDTPRGQELLSKPGESK